MQLNAGRAVGISERCIGERLHDLLDRALKRRMGMGECHEMSSSRNRSARNGFAPMAGRFDVDDPVAVGVEAVRFPDVDRPSPSLS